MVEVLRQEPWMPRPMLNIHVRQGDKGREMRLMSFDAYMLAAYRVREYEPFLQNVWLSTEMQVGGWVVTDFKIWRWGQRLPLAMQHTVS